MSSQNIQSVMVRALQGLYPPGPGCDHGPPVEANAEPLPLGRWQSLVEHLLAVHLPGVPRPRALRQLAARAFDFYLQDATGTPINTMLAMGPEKFLVRAASLSQRFVLGGVWVVTPLEAGHISTRVEAYPLPSEYLAGLVQHSLTLAGGSQVAVEVLSEGGGVVELDIHYREAEPGRVRPA